MTDYKAIQGYTVEKLSSDPSSVIEGKLFYNDTSNVFKVGAAGTSAWATTNALQSARTYMTSAGTSASASMIMGGTAGTPTNSDKTESFDGTNWTELAGLNVARSNLCGGGTTTTAALACNGNLQPGNSNATELWNGLAWTVGPTTNYSGGARGSSGNAPQTSMLAFGGSPYTGDTEDYNGTSWTEVANLSSARDGLNGLGSVSTAALALGGWTPRPPPPSGTISAIVEEWNGASWTTVTSIGTASASNTTFGSVTAGLRAGGYPPTTVNTELWNGTAWTETSNSNVANGYRNMNGGGTQTSGMMSGGTPVPTATASEEWSLNPIAARTVTTS